MQQKKPLYTFPPAHHANSDGLLAVGGDLSADRLLTAYLSGIFPWYSQGQPILWWSPDPRMVLFPEKFKVSKSLQQLMRKRVFRVTYNQSFEKVIQQCASVKRAGQNGTWITPEMISAYTNLHHLGFAKSVEVWEEEKLVGGLYGIYLKDKGVFCGESMFTKVSNASKYAFAHWVEKLKQDKVKLIDCQVYTDHLASLGAEEIPREEFLSYL